MQTTELKELPSLIFAHSFEAPTYSNTIIKEQGKIEVSYIVEGSMNVTVGDEEYEFEAGDILCNFHDKPMYVQSDGFHRHHTVCMCCDWKKVDNAGGLYVPFLTKSCHGTGFVREIIDDFVFSSYIYELSPTRTAVRFLDILNKIDEINRSNFVFKAPEYSIIAQRAKKFIQQNIEKPISQRDVAQFLGVSPGYLCNVFKKSEGITFIKYVNAVKLKNIQLLMQKEGLKLYEAAGRYGYTDANYVSCLYKKMFGRSITAHPNRARLNAKGGG